MGGGTRGWWDKGERSAASTGAKGEEEDVSVRLLSENQQEACGRRRVRVRWKISCLLLGLGQGKKTKERSGQGAHPFPVRYALSQGHATRAGGRLAGPFTLLMRPPPLFVRPLRLTRGNLATSEASIRTRKSRSMICVDCRFPLWLNLNLSDRPDILAGLAHSQFSKARTDDRTHRGLEKLIQKAARTCIDFSNRQGAEGETEQKKKTWIRKNASQRARPSKGPRTSRRRGGNLARETRGTRGGGGECPCQQVVAGGL